LLKTPILVCDWGKKNNETMSVKNKLKWILIVGSQLRLKQAIKRKIVQQLFQSRNYVFFERSLASKFSN